MTTVLSTSYGITSFSCDSYSAQRYKMGVHKTHHHFPNLSHADHYIKHTSHHQFRPAVISSSSSAVNMPTQIGANETDRLYLNFSPSPNMWGDLFINYNSDPQVKESYSKEIEGLKNEVRSMLNGLGSKMDTINIIDTLERLGVSYHFENEIEEKLRQIFNLKKYYKKEAYDLYTVALYFRLMRQHGYPISSEIFGKWIDGNGKFQESLKSDAKSLLSLYEASFLRTRGETILDDALDFATANLKSTISNLGSPLREQVEHALFQPLHLGIPRIESRHFISIYEEEEHKNETLLRLAKLDFNLLQILHREELQEVSSWWKELDLVSKIPYARDRVVECFFNAMAVYYEPQYSRARIMFAKAITMISILDDTYDCYAAIHELDILDEAIQRWDIKHIDELPEPLKAFYKVLLNLYQQFEEDLAKEGRSFATYYAIEAYKEISRYYHVEAKWFIQGYLPPFEEYLSVGLITGAASYLVTALFMGVESAMKDVFDWISTNPKMMVATQTNNRLVNDIATYEVEKQRGQIATGIDCYMKQYCVTKEEAMEHFSERGTNAWKDINKEGLIWPSSYSRDVFLRVLNLSRTVYVHYKGNEDGYSKPGKIMKSYVMNLLLNQIKV